MRKTIFVFVFLIIGFFLLSAKMDSAADRDTKTRTDMPKEEAIFEKFQDAKEWVEENKPSAEQFISEGIEKFQKEKDQAVESMKEKINEFGERNYKEM